MRLVVLLSIWMPLAAQEKHPATPAETKPAAAETAPAASPVPSTETWLSGSIDLGYRWRSGVGGSFDTYRSIVNLGSGPKLLGAEFTLTDPSGRLPEGQTFEYVYALPQ